ncbi:diaminopimelate dehydrogenase [Proteus terrae]|uniref:Meso-diaminopimelate D-dehydrogenase n=1 Tax=Proteus terrae subsp. cibarius TaxID=626774 RepID=A0A6I6G181_9GAMM|nr:diaminopimelate dehydrogenase [Proteus terrae]MBG2913524.1 diaminopimelate dehydrogenase [Proteus terrae subsp. cibarius]QGW02117.1 diaminopimelate dehydrogenase [Proteus terrae subsp. cibarius]QHD94780.1 diaminopimelate dehydrogenase [Proteus terrae subsp. cibarius]QIF90868.1 diaminopimelate dehydrogenase [Proteus terrae subsp. cibarius]QIF97177.1 diaminopimelate dehydrogenase [Proteus terrae subsp. cibarius]
MNTKIKVAIVGYGNIGRFALEAVQAAQDFELVGVVRRDINNVPEELQNITVTNDIKTLGDVDVALLCSPTRAINELAKSILSLGINTVDSFDVHSEIVSLKTELDDVAKKHDRVAVISAGWDPGSDSIVRALMLAMAPKGITYTNFGPGMSMGHSVAAKAIEGVKDALSMTIPLGTGVHRRMVYVELEAGANFNQVEQAIKADSYFSSDETHVKQVDSVDSLKDVGHGVHMTHKGVSGKTHNQLFEYSMRINNPALTSQFMVSAARASMKQRAGAYTVIEIPPVDFLAGDLNTLIAKLV